MHPTIIAYKKSGEICLLQSTNFFISSAASTIYAGCNSSNSIRGRNPHVTSQAATPEVSGEATITATDNGDHFTDNLFINKNRKLHQGFAMVILRSTQTAGKVKVKVSSKELKGIKKELLTK